MRVLILADIHGSAKAIHLLADEAAACQGVVLAGDITHFGGPDELAPILAAVEAFGKPIFAVPGNCDLTAVDHMLQQRQHSVHANVKILDGFAFLGAGGSLPCPGTTPNESGESVFQDILDAAVTLTEQKPMILVTHQPAWNTALDTTYDGRHTGSRAIRDFIEKHRPLLAVSGHMHEALGIDTLGPTTLVNPGPFRHGRYAVAELALDTVQVKVLQLKVKN
jgi:Icc-related predicted phosphoesterase